MAWFGLSKEEREQLSRIEANQMLIMQFLQQQAPPIEVRAAPIVIERTEIAQSLRRVERHLLALRGYAADDAARGESMSAELDRLKNEVAEMRTVNQSATALLGQLAQLIRNNQTNPQELAALADDLDAQSNALAAAIAANTPASEPTPTPEPPPPGGEV